ncbi:MAG: tetratricopeptide repeat protein [Cyanobacteria bacterium J06642_3]
MTTFQEEAISLKAESAEDHVNLGLILSNQGKIDAALAAYQTAINLDPKYAIAHNNLGTILENQGKIDAALAAYQKAINLEPKYAIAHYNLGSILQSQGQLESALASYRTAISIDPEYVEAYYNLGVALQETGQIEGAIAAYQTAISLKPDYHLAKFGLVLAQIPVIYASQEEITTRRYNYERSLENLANYYRSATQQERAEAAEAVGWRQPFYLAYQGLCDRDLQQTYGNMIHQLMVSCYPQWGQARSLPQLEANQKLRIGFVSGFFNHHSVWKIPLQGWVENLDRSEFELYGYYTGNKSDRETSRAAKAFDRFEHGSLSVAQWAEKIVADELHVLIFPEFGMERLTLQLGCLRLAPLQVAFGGHPETSGLPTIDYHLSSDLMEPGQGHEHYTEQLVRLPNLAVCYKLISIQPEARSKQQLGIKDDEIMFWCCQSLFKYLPQHDDVFPRIAQELPNAKFVFIKLEAEFATNIFCQRLACAFKEFDLDYQDYCLFLPRLNSNAFNGTAAIADVFLDNIGWAGNNTTMESTAYNLPIVTFPTELMRGRHTMAILKMMGVSQTIAQSKDEYIQIAVRLGQDSSYRQQISQQIARNKHKLYRDLEPVRALEDWLLQATNKSRRANSTKVAEIFQLAVQAHQAKKLDAAQAKYLEVLEIQPNHGEALYALGTIAQQLGDLAAAEQYLANAVTVQPKFIKAWFSLGNLRQSQNQFETAEQAYRQALTLRPDSAPIYNNLGYVLQQQSKWSEAAVAYKQALSLMPNCTEADVNWGNALFAQGKLDPDQQLHYAQLNYKLGLKRHRVQDWQTAITYYRQAILMESQLIDAHYHLGLALQKQRKLTEAMACYQQVLQLAPDRGVVYYNLGQIFQDLGDLDQATHNFKLGLKLINPNYAPALESSSDKATSFADNFSVPEIPQGEVKVGDYQFPAIPAVTEPEAERPFWSIVIPVVNRPEYFPECLASVLAQWTRESEMEIIVLDNGSDPPQWKIPQDLGKGIVRYYRFDETISLQENWNTAVSLCRGKWIHLLHHDDYVLPEFYARFKASLATCPESVGAAFTGYQIINDNRQIIHNEQYNLENYRGIVADWVQQIGAINTTSPPSLVIKRAAYEKLGGYKPDILYTCDWELYKRIASFYDWWYEPGILAHYRQQANSITISENTNGASGFDHLRAIEISQSYLPVEHCADITARSRFNYFYWCLERAEIPLKVGNLNGALQLIKAANEINNSPQALEALLEWLQQSAAAPLVKQLAQLEPDDSEVEQNTLASLCRNILDRKQQESCIEC